MYFGQFLSLGPTLFLFYLIGPINVKKIRPRPTLLYRIIRKFALNLNHEPQRIRSSCNGLVPNYFGRDSHKNNTAKQVVAAI